jgi:hypothetical protein
MACDPATLEAIQALEGHTKSVLLVVEKTGWNVGTLALVEAEEGEDVGDADPAPFIYNDKNGVMTFQERKEDFELDGRLYTAYGKDKDVTLNGQLVIKMGEDLRITMTIKGSKPLENSVQ